MYVAYKGDLDDLVTPGVPPMGLKNKRDGELHRVFLDMKRVITVSSKRFWS